LGDNIGHLSPNSQLDSGAYKGIGTNVDLLNSLTPYKQPIYYYDKSETIKVKPEVEKQLEGRALVDDEFSFTFSAIPKRHLYGLRAKYDCTEHTKGAATHSKTSLL